MLDYLIATLILLAVLVTLLASSLLFPLLAYLLVPLAVLLTFPLLFLAAEVGFIALVAATVLVWPALWYCERRSPEHRARRQLAHVRGLMEHLSKVRMAPEEQRYVSHKLFLEHQRLLDEAYPSGR
jgi:hypothetical protein